MLYISTGIILICSLEFIFPDHIPNILTVTLIFVFSVVHRIEFHMQFKINSLDHVSRRLCQIDVHLSIMVGSLHVFPLDQTLLKIRIVSFEKKYSISTVYLYSLLDDERTGLEPLVELLHNFRHELVVV